MMTLTLSLLLLAFKCAVAARYDFPNPTVNYEECGNVGKSFICDPQKYLNNYKKFEIGELLLSMKNAEYFKCGYIAKSHKIGVQIGIAIIDTFSSYPIVDDVTLKNKNKYKLSEIYAKQIHHEWGIGKKYCNNGILIFLSIKDKVIYLSTGSGVKHIVDSYWIKNTLIPHIMKPMLKRKQYDTALYASINKIKNRISAHGSKTSIKSIKAKEIKQWAATIFWGFVFICGFAGCISHIDSNIAKKTDCSTKLSEINESFKNRTFDKNICPICLTNFDKKTNDYKSSGKELKVIRIKPGCGHKFCEECLIKRLDNNINKIPNKFKCLICETGNDNDFGDYYETLFYKELEFRVLSVSKIYPEFIKDKYIKKWLHCDFNGNIRLPQKKIKSKNVNANDNDTYDNNVINDYYSSDVSVKSSISIRSTGGYSYSFSGGSISCGSGGGGGWSS